MPKYNKKQHSRTVSLRAKMVMSFALFSVIVLAILWLFQVFLLDDIYKLLKQRDLNNSKENIVSLISGDYDRESLDALASKVAKESGICVSVYEIKEENGRKSGELIIEKHINSLCFIHNLRGESLLNKLYQNAKSNNGEYEERFSITTMFGKPNSDENNGENIILCNIVPVDGAELLIMLNSELVPLGSTVDTVHQQLVVISIILMIVAIIMALIFSSRISKPIREMSDEASKLVIGNYNVNFDGGNCTETVNLSATLNRAAYELSKLDRMQKDLMANVSHDLRTPLTMIAGYTEVMRDLPGEATPENMQIVIDETARLTHLVNDMLEASKYQDGTQRLNLTRFNFTEMLRNTLERYAKLKERDGYKIILETDRDVFVEADEGRILQVLYNLINNAVNYTGEDKTVVIRQTYLDNNDKKQVALQVIDTGCGIAEEDLPLVWERYYKVHDFHKRANMGTGLGLSIVKNILLLHQAEFGVNSQIGVGSCFWFKLDVSPTETE